ncbi:predicted protein [Uncinocarpus reesii 1704]|uniref:Cytochrome P450 n=1 Tax=Uncinocarpus reesii (strain UAMH 1704) TaxID=336963 RepID=C4JDJ3_UNCRE|nr:uncharacterized protein UREG_00753 [Uncinocarpus reesii 1704]EEP75906.1 predicted protein [Uncinocarpus reesii 1704]
MIFIVGTDRHDILLMHRKYGPAVQLGPREISFCHADALPQIYAGPKGLDSGDALLALRNYGTDNLITTLDADLHAARRKMIIGLYSGPAVAAPAFQAGFKKYIEQFMQVIEAKATASPCRTVDVSSWLRWLTGDIVIHHVYGEKNHPNLLREEKSRETFNELFATTMDTMTGPFAILAGWFPRLTTPLRKSLAPDKIGRSMMEQVESAIISKVPENKETPVTHLEQLTSILKKDGPSHILPDKNFIASDCFDNFAAGSFIPADLLCALVWELSLPQNKTYQNKLRQELHDAGISPGTYPDLSVVQKLPYLDGVLREVLRLYIPLPFGLPRVVKKGQEVTVLGTKIPAGMTIHSQAYCLHRDPNAFPDPENWNPERWNIPIMSPKYREMQRMFWPFGSGPRMCSGKNVAWAELRLTTARIYSTYETALDQAFLDKNGALLPNQERKGYFPFKLAEPIRFLKV